MDYFVEEGAQAQKVSDPKKRAWIERRDRGEMKNGKKSGLMIPSQKAVEFFEQIDTLMASYECKAGFTEPFTFESVMAKVYDNVDILDKWEELTSSLHDEMHQTAFLENVVQVYRRFLGHANGDRVIRGLKRRKTVAVRENLKKN